MSGPQSVIDAIARSCASSSDDDPMHITCCVNDDVALCGADVTESPWRDEGDECHHCARVESLTLHEWGNCHLCLLNVLRDQP